MSRVILSSISFFLLLFASPATSQDSQENVIPEPEEDNVVPQQEEVEIEIEEPVKKRKKKKRGIRRNLVLTSYSYVLPSTPLGELSGNGHKASLTVRHLLGKGRIKYALGFKGSAAQFTKELSAPRDTHASPSSKLIQYDADLMGSMLYYFTKKLAVVTDVGAGYARRSFYIVSDSTELGDDYYTANAFKASFYIATEYSKKFSRSIYLLYRLHAGYTIGTKEESAALNYTQQSIDINQSQIELGFGVGLKLK